MCNKAFDKYAQYLEGVSDHLKTHEMCDKAVDSDPSLPNTFYITCLLFQTIINIFKLKKKLSHQYMFYGE